ncbi:hypothetical protein Kpol_1057p16 [Vanderwaltozyma polyspora DSM 70294]|uniref:Uridylate kinase n=1 Tax=Vanderwaltozyma polyspora (strain ATCC 22028 / DSM 70294 / BCRC 21397 / CBS 2163 / NBRC 10782 / NRRL Y-8283 / UCD 57-17) TaxID=436907 RepID=A7TPI4_VANPO|nr:uncharacterized protein Kpol_1057p16 [Vanderwaltozyma polyspora DSM 70294]EDO15828.1 hypothetical protein Kpol_1057p16 [Vanderwaltozyma polyspora DSM 70294]
MFRAVSKRIGNNGFNSVRRSGFVWPAGGNFARNGCNRFYSSINQGSKNGGNKGKTLLVLGLLALGTTGASVLYQRSSPKEFLEEPKVKKSAGSKAFFSADEVSVVFVLGGPGAGKGTQCDKLVKNHQFVHLSAGDLLRAEQNREGSQYGELIKKYIKDGLIVPQEITIALLKNAMSENVKEGRSKFLVDGFPRKMDQAVIFEEEIVPSKFVLFFECPEDVMLRRLLERGKTSGRSDDNIESIRKRFRTFVDTSMPVVDYFDKMDKVVKVSCDEPVDVVYGHVEDAIKAKIDRK